MVLVGAWRALPAALAALALLATAPVGDAEVSLRHLAPVGRCAHAEDESASRPEQERAMRCLVAYARHIAGAPPVRRHQLLDRSARLKARRILACGYTHTPCGDSPARPFFQASYAPGFAADEDIAEGRIGLDTARETMRDLLRSKRGHGEALIDPRWRDIGVAQRNGRLGGDRSGIWVIHVGMRRAR